MIIPDLNGVYVNSSKIIRGDRLECKKPKKAHNSNSLTSIPWHYTDQHTCHREVGPATEYGCLLIGEGKQREILPRGSIIQSMLRTLSLVILMPLALWLTYTMDTPQYC